MPGMPRPAMRRAIGRFYRCSQAHAAQYPAANPPQPLLRPNWNEVLTVPLDDRRRADPRVQRVALSDRRRAVAEVRPARFEVVLPERLGDDHADLDEVLELQAAGGQRRRTDA